MSNLEQTAREALALAEKVTKSNIIVGWCEPDKDVLVKAFAQNVDESIKYNPDTKYWFINTEEDFVVAHFGNGPTSEKNAMFWAQARLALPALAQGYLDLLAQNRRLNDKIDEERLDSCPQLDENPNAHPNITKKGIAVRYGKLHFSMLSSMEAYFVSANDVEELLAQIAQLKSENEKLKESELAEYKDAAKYQKQNAKMIEALKFYADGNGNEEKDIETIKDPPWGDKYCYGKTARAVLAEVENG